jgi:hypothetical protein
MHTEFFGEPEDNIQLGRTRLRWKDTVELYPKETGCEECRVLVNAVMFLRVTQKSENFLTSGVYLCQDVVWWTLQLLFKFNKRAWNLTRQVTVSF